MNINKQKFFLPILLPVLVLLVFGCSKSTEGKDGKLSGTVILNNDTGNPAYDPVDYSGVTVALYKPAELDTTFVRLNNTYPNLGVQVSQETEFDHRLQNPVKVTQTSGDGSFSLSNIKPGTYNLVVMKEGWGVRYLYDVDIQDGDNEIKSKICPQLKANNIELYPALSLSGVIAEAFSFKAGHSYIIKNNLTFSGDVTIYPTTNIWFNPNAGITCVASLNIETANPGFFLVTSADSMYISNKILPSQIRRWNGISCYQGIQIGNNSIQKAVTTFSTNGWTLQTAGIQINDMVFKYCGSGLQFSNINDVTVSRCNISYSDSTGLWGISFIQCNQTEINNSIFINNAIAISQDTSTEANVSNCYFFHNSVRDILNSYETTGLVEHCDFIASNTCIETAGNSNTTIQYCNIQGIIGILNTAYVRWRPSWFTANYNNLNCSQYAVKARGRFYEIEIHNCEQNYWYTTNTNEIDELIWDMHDEDPNEPAYEEYIGVVDYLPYRTSRVANAGCQL
ncbi:MAG TPA: hypothetical protein PKJ14_01720 [Candidatus Cloacimonadota bacterium]|mgnify:FL=1|nr:hypothetical protein [Candidatus Cloacimonadota bacterium]HQL14423.1 hypothetical protein [Candidatus Cloacimonadota bacterium]